MDPVISSTRPPEKINHGSTVTACQTKYIIKAGVRNVSFVYLVCKLCHTVEDRGSRMSNPGGKETL